MKKQYFLILMLTASFALNAQLSTNIDKYKYVIVKSKFDFVKQPDGYKTSSLTKFVFDKIGIKTLLDTETFPSDLAQNRCLALSADVKDKSSVFKTITYLELKDCYGNLVYKSPEGVSRIKDYKRAYYQSMTEAFKEIRTVKYSYNQEASLSKDADKSVSIKKGKSKKVEKKSLVVAKKEEVKTTNELPKTKVPVLYAQENELGFQLVNTKPEVVFILLKTSDSQRYIIKDMNGMFIKKGENWIAEYYKKNQLVTEIFKVKF